MKQIRLNAFDMNCVGHIQQGLWTHPRDRSTDYASLDHWVGLAQTLERGLFDGLFLADVLGVYDVHGGSPDPAIRNAVQVPVNDPMLLIPAMAHATRHLGFGVTVNLTYDPPFPFARRMSTLDHLTQGRIGWNIVTGYLDSAARAMGLDKQVAHDDRYDVADDYMQAVYKLWEGSWADDAVRADRVTGTYADPARVRQALMGGFANSRILEVHGERMVKRNFDPGFRIELHQKDLNLALSGARALGISLPNTATCQELFNAAAAAGGSAWDHSGMVRVLERLACHEVGGGKTEPAK